MNACCLLSGRRKEGREVLVGPRRCVYRKAATKGLKGGAKPRAIEGLGGVRGVGTSGRSQIGCVRDNEAYC